jgi:arylsulfotransferase ASST
VTSVRPGASGGCSLRTSNEGTHVLIESDQRTAKRPAKRLISFVLRSILGSRRGRLAVVASSALVIAGVLSAGARAQPPTPGEVTFSTTPSLYPDFLPNIKDYVVRCNDAPVTVQGHTSGDWEAQAGDYPFLSGDFVEVVPLSAGQAFTITVRRVGSSEVYSYHVRCLPDDFPTYSFTRQGSVSPKYFSVNQEYSTSGSRYGIIFDNHGVPLWWYPAPARGIGVLPDRNLLWANRFADPASWEIHRLDGSLVRTVTGVGHGTNDHDLQLLGNGDHLLGAYVRQSHVDTSAYGGSSDATVVTTELQQVSPDGQLLWDWNSQGHISLAETGHRWPWAVKNGYDIQHWNSIEPAGNSVIASFRNLDAVYKINKSTGNIVWKLGGTTTPQSLRVLNDAHSSVLGAQHDARLQPDGTVTVFNNRTNLGQESGPEAVRFRINGKNRTATLLESITDPNVPASNCCGSALRLGNGNWLIDWGAGMGNGIGGYKPNGKRTFFLRFDSGYSYRAVPVPAGVISAQDLRDGMDVMCSSGCG